MHSIFGSPGSSFFNLILQPWQRFIVIVRSDVLRPVFGSCVPGILRHDMTKAHGRKGGL